MKYIKTDVGQQAFKARSSLFSTRQRAAFIMFDGVKPLKQVLAATAGLGITPDDVEHLLAQGFLAPVLEPAAQVLDSAPASETQTASLEASVSQDRYKRAMPIATQLTAGLGLRGFRLNLAIEAASGFDELQALLPKIREAVGAKNCASLEQALNS
jgi:hypothetical protein